MNNIHTEMYKSKLSGIDDDRSTSLFERGGSGRSGSIDYR